MLLLLLKLTLFFCNNAVIVTINAAVAGVAVINAVAVVVVLVRVLIKIFAVVVVVVVVVVLVVEDVRLSAKETKK